MRTLLLLLLLTAMPSRAAVILLYHHIATDTPPSTTTSPSDFESHLSYLKDNGFTVVDLADVVLEAKGQKTLPDKAVAITFDDGYQDIADNAAPLLARFGYPYTLFVNPERVGRPGMMSANTMAAMVGATVANHTAGHAHLTTLPLKLARQTIIDGQLPGNPKWLAWPYGEYSPELEALAADMGYVAFGQQSGPSGPYSSLTALPRFPAAGPYANLGTLKTKLLSLHMPLVSSDTSMVQGDRSPALTLELKDSDPMASRFACYFLGQRVAIEMDGTRFKIPAIALPPGRSRLNCTAPSKTKAGRYYWWSQAWLSGQGLK
ncbi:polysaccharide deacetylase family protein [Gallaecimonas xiamenensis]|uniref:Polysaccharide deacetylase n=1 Tax=Gallaecimonas xiamenensis 3-C-1 TaxID=745411 RepID=K2JSN0_9GAMM|nr:polysaccharide deacetylase family protein [Gallaecimonas xiamenensis]EKE77512.1 polysaccharide deacetylase [Gallaecimonas xiamenensis 3-C-1]